MATRGGEAKGPKDRYPGHFANTVKDSLGHCKPLLIRDFEAMRESRKAVT